MDVVSDAANKLAEKLKHANLTERIPMLSNITSAVKQHAVLQEVDDDVIIAVLFCGILALAVFSVLLIFCWLIGKTRKRLDLVLMIGPEDVGKTRLFLSLTGNSNFELTCTSLCENVAPLKIGKQDLTLVDIPGNGRIIWPIFDKFKSSCAKLVFVVDSCSVFKDQRAQTGEYLFFVLTDPIISKLKPKVFIVCTKQDVQMAKSPALVKQVLESELTTLKKTSQATLGDTNDSPKDSSGRNKRSAVLVEGKHGNVDLFLLPYKVQFLESKMVKESDGSQKISLNAGQLK